MKDKFIEEIKLYLKDFTFDGENNFTKEIQKQLPDQILIVNNQQVKQPGQVIILQLKVELFGEGFVDDEEFLLVHFILHQNNNKIRELFESFYLDEVDKFKITCNQFFNI